MKKLFFTLLFIIVLIVIVSAVVGVKNRLKDDEYANMPIAQKFPSRWKEPSIDITKKLSPVLYKYHAKCGEYFIKQSSVDDDYLITCTQDGKWWDLYLYDSHLNIIEPKYDKIENPY